MDICCKQLFTTHPSLKLELSNQIVEILEHCKSISNKYERHGQINIVRDPKTSLKKESREKKNKTSSQSLIDFRKVKKANINFQKISQKIPQKVSQKASQQTPQKIFNPTERKYRQLTIEEYFQ